MAELRRQLRTLEDATATEIALTDISKKEILMVRTRESWLENAECERNGLAKHFQSLNIADPKKPYIIGMSPTTTLIFWQPIAVAFILGKERSFMKDCVINDQAGLGKTFEILTASLFFVIFQAIVVLISFLSSKEKNANWSYRINFFDIK